MTPLISVIIPTYRDWRRLQQCLECLSDQTMPSDQFEVIVVNNDPQDLCPFSESLASNVAIVNESRPGSYAARNRGAEQARGEILAFTDSDCRPAPQWLSTVAEVLHRSPTSLVTGPIRIFPVSGGEHLAFLHDTAFAFAQNSPARFQIGQTANLSVSRRTFNIVGPFESTLFSGGDTEWIRRAKTLGHKIDYIEAAVVGHPSRASYEELARKKRRQAGGRAMTKKIVVRSVLWDSLKPPINRLRAVNLESLSKKEVFQLFLMCWRLRLVFAAEFMRVRYLRSRPERL